MAYEVINIIQYENHIISETSSYGNHCSGICINFNDALQCMNFTLGCHCIQIKCSTINS